MLKKIKSKGLVETVILTLSDSSEIKMWYITLLFETWSWKEFNDGCILFWVIKVI